MGTFRININQETGTDINIINNGIAGENLISGDLCYLNVDGKYWKSNASAISKCSTELRVAKVDINSNDEGPFIAQGSITGSGFTVGVRYYVATLSGQITTTELSSPNLVRYIGTASSVTELEFNPMDLNYNKFLQEQLNDITSDLNYEHIQGTVSNQWFINHNLNKKPSINIVDSAGTQVIGDVTYTDVNNVVINFSAAFSGSAILN